MFTLRLWFDVVEKKMKCICNDFWWTHIVALIWLVTVKDCQRVSLLLRVSPRVHGPVSALISVEHLNDVCMRIDFSWCELYWWYDEDSGLCCSRVQPVWWADLKTADLFVFEGIMVLQFKSSSACIGSSLADCQKMERWISQTLYHGFDTFVD